MVFVLSMYFFEIRSFSELENYMDWLESQNTYPVEFYLNGVCYELSDEKSRSLFCLGQEAIFNTIGDIIK